MVPGSGLVKLKQRKKETYPTDKDSKGQHSVFRIHHMNIHMNMSWRQGGWSTFLCTRPRGSRLCPELEKGEFGQKDH